MDRQAKHIGIAWTGLLVALAGAVAQAQERAPRAIDLATALQLADGANPDLAAMRAGARAETQRAEAARRAGWPEFVASMDFSETDNPVGVFAGKLSQGDFGQSDFDIGRLNDPAALANVTTALTLRVPLDVSGAIRARADAAMAGAGAHAAVTGEARQEMRLGVVRAYQDAVVARAALAVTRKALEGARARESQMESRVGQGAALHSDVLRVRSRRREREADVAQAESDVAAALAALQRALGVDRSDPVAPADEPVPQAQTLADLASWSARAESQRDSVEAARRRLDAAAKAVHAESRAGLPALSAFARVQDDRWDSAQQSAAIGVNLAVPVFDPTRGRRLGAARADEDAASQGLRASIDQVRLEVASAHARARAARSRLEAASGGADDGREALRVVQERRAAGMATLTDELDTESASLRAELEELRAATGVGLADATLARAAGEL